MNRPLQSIVFLAFISSAYTFNAAALAIDAQSFEVLSRSCANCGACIDKKKAMAKEAGQRRTDYEEMMANAKRMAADLDPETRAMYLQQVEMAESSIQDEYAEDMADAELGLNCDRCDAFKMKCIENLESLYDPAKFDLLSNYSAADIKRYLEYALLAEESYGGDTARNSQILKTESGNHILITTDNNGDVVIAFKGTSLPSKGELATLGVISATEFVAKKMLPLPVKTLASSVSIPSPTAQYAGNMQSVKDMAANVQQYLGKIPKQYEEGVAVVSHIVANYPPEKKITVIGHSKGGGQALYASVAASMAVNSTDKVSRVNTVVFNPAVINDMNWVKLINQSANEIGMKEVASRLGYQSEIMSISMDGDPVSLGTLLDPNPSNSPGALLLEEQLERRVVKPSDPAASAMDRHTINRLIMEMSQLYLANKDKSGQCSGCQRYIRALAQFSRQHMLQ